MLAVNRNRGLCALLGVLIGASASSMARRYISNVAMPARLRLDRPKSMAGIIRGRRNQ